MIEEGFSKFAVEDFYESFMEQLDKLDNGEESCNSDTSATLEVNVSNGVSSSCETDIINSNENSKLGMMIFVHIKIIRHFGEGGNCIKFINVKTYNTVDYMQVYVCFALKACVSSQKGNLIETFNDQGMSDYIVVFLRLLTSMHLKKDAEFYQNFMEGDMTVANFCRYCIS